MATHYTHKVPMQSRYSPEEVARLDAWIAQQEFPPSRADVQRKALLAWLDMQDAKAARPPLPEAQSAPPDLAIMATPPPVPSGMIAKRPAPPEDTPGPAMGADSAPLTEDTEAAAHQRALARIRSAKYRAKKRGSKARS